MRGGLLLLLFIALSLLTNAQGENTHWYFGHYAGVRFTSAGPLAVTNSSMASGEGIASVSDASGALLFYTNGLKVWNRNHQLMPNGQDLQGNLSTSQGVVIVPIPRQPGRYYVFTLTDMSAGGDLTYSLVDLSLQGGLGDVVTTQKNVQLESGLTEKMVAVQGSCGIWVINTRRQSKEFQARLVNSNGVSGPVLSSAGTTHTVFSGGMKASRDNQRLVVTHINGVVDVLPFDPVTGTVSEGISVGSFTGGYNSYGACLSADRTRLYVDRSRPDGRFDVFQFDMTLNNAAAINASQLLVGTCSSNLPFSDLQLGPDDRIYIARQNRNFLGLIQSPNVPGLACGFVEDGVGLGGRFGGLCLPNEVRVQNEVLDFSLGPDTTICPGGPSITLHHPLPPGATALWSNGATTPSISVSAEGAYWLLLSRGHCSFADTIRVQLEKPVKLPEDRSICPGTSLTLDAGSYPGYRWSDQSTGRTLEVSSPGRYWVEVPLRCGGSSRDTIEVLPWHLPPPRLGADTAICPGGSFRLRPGYFVTFDWQDGSRDSSLLVSRPGTYSVRVVDVGGCQRRDTVVVTAADCPQEIWVPTSFTPNGDGLNDRFFATVRGACESFELQVFDRWGAVVFRTMDPAQGWDGRVQGRMAPAGVFVWSCTYQLAGKEKRTQKGTVTVVR